MDHRTLQDGVVADPHVPAQRAVLAQAGAGSDDAVVADDRGAVDDHGRIDLCPLAQPHPRAELEAVDVHLDLLVEDVLVGLEVGLERADVLPVAVGHVPVEGLPGRQGLGKGLAGEVHRLSFGDEVEDLRLEHVDPGVDGVTEHLAPCRLLEEPLDGAVLVGDHDAELQRVVHRLQGEGGQTAPPVVEVDHLGQIDVGEDVPRDDQKALVQFVAGVPHRSGGAERRGLGGIDHADAELRSVAEVGADGVGHERHGDHDVLEAVLAEQVDHVLHHRNVDHGQHGLGLVGGQRPQSGALATGHDDGFHRGLPDVMTSYRPSPRRPRPSPSARPSERCGPPGRRRRRQSRPG